MKHHQEFVIAAINVYGSMYELGEKVSEAVTNSIASGRLPLLNAASTNRVAAASETKHKLTQFDTLIKHHNTLHSSQFSSLIHSPP